MLRIARDQMLFMMKRAIDSANELNQALAQEGADVNDLIFKKEKFIKNSHELQSSLRELAYGNFNNKGNRK